MQITCINLLPIKLGMQNGCCKNAEVLQVQGQIFSCSKKALGEV